MTANQVDHGETLTNRPADRGGHDVGGPDLQRPLGGLQAALAVLLPLSAVVGLISGYVSYRRAELIEGVLAGNPISAAQADAADTLVMLWGSIDIAVYVPAGAVFLFWFWRLAKNAAVLDPRRAPGAGWALGSWLVPVANAWLPARNLIRADRVSGRIVDRDTRGSRRLVIAWGVVFALAAIGSVGLWLSAPDQLLTITDVEAYARADRYDVLPQAALALAAVLALLMVRRVTRRQELAFADRDAARSESASLLH